LSETLTSWDPQEMALAGVVISVEHDGRLYFAHGVVAKADAGKLARLRRQREEASANRLRSTPKTSAIENEAPNTEEAASDSDPSEEVAEAPWEEPRATLPRALVRDLTSIRTTASAAN
jgi:hypothetical protein